LNDDAENGRRRRRSYGFALLLVACALVGRAVFITQPVSSDTAMFVYMGKLVCEGKQIGVDLIDNKLPSVGLLMSLPYKVMGSAWWAYATFGLVLMILAPLLLARSAGRVLGRHAAVPVGVAAAIWLNFPPMVYGQLQLETMQVFFVVLGACAGLELLKRRDWRDAITMGLCVGVAMWAKPTAGAILPAIGLAIAMSAWTWKQKLGAIAWIGIGVLIPTLVCAWLLMLTGMLEPLPATIAQIRDYSTNSTAEWTDLVKPLFVVGVLMFPVVVWGVVFRRDKQALTPTLSRGYTGEGVRCTLVVLTVAWLVMELIGVISQRRMYAYHFLPMGAPAALMVGLFARRLRMVSLGFAFGPAAALSVIFAGQVMISPDPQARMTSVIAYLNDRARPTDGVWMDDYARLMVETDFVAGSRVPLTFLFGNSDPAPLRFGQIILNDLRSRQPEWVVLHEDVEKYIQFYRHHMVEIAAFPERGKNFATAWRDIDSYVRANYVIDQQIDNMQVMRRAEAVVGTHE